MPHVGREQCGGGLNGSVLDLDIMFLRKIGHEMLQKMSKMDFDPIAGQSSTWRFHF